METSSSFSHFIISILGGDIKVILTITGFIFLGILATKYQSSIIRERSFEIIILSMICSTVLIVAVQRETKHEVYAGLLGTIIGYFFNISRPTGKKQSEASEQ